MGNILRHKSVLFVALLTLASVTRAEEKIAPESIPGVTRADAEGVLALVEKTPRRVISAKDRPALFYCNGVKCGRSGVAVTIAKHCGFTRLYWYRGGFEDWKQKGYPYLKQ